MRRLIGVGVGPGDPELITVKAVRVLQTADVVYVPVSAGRSAARATAAPPGRAETIVRAHVDPTRIRRLGFTLGDGDGCRDRQVAEWRVAATAVAGAFDAGAATVAFGTLGDPNLYSTFGYLAATVRAAVPGVQVETVPGITAMQDLAARAGAVLTPGTALAAGDESVVLLPATAGPAAFRAALAGRATVVGYKLGSAAGPDPAHLRDLLAAAGRLAGAVIGSRLGLPGEDIRPAADLLADASPLPYLSTLIVPARRDEEPGRPT